MPITMDERLIEMDGGPYEGADLRNPSPEPAAFFKDYAGSRRRAVAVRRAAEQISGSPKPVTGKGTLSCRAGQKFSPAHGTVIGKPSEAGVFFMDG